MKKVIAFSLVLCMMLTTMTACGKAPAASQSTPPPSSAQSGTASGDTTTPGKPVTITMWHGQGGANGKLLEELANDYNESQGKDKNITVNITYQDNIAQKMKSVMLADDVKNMPDVVLGTGLDSSYYRDLSYLLWAEDMIGKDPSFKKEDVLATSANSVLINDRLMGLPFSNSSIVLFYNKDMFREAGLDPESPPKTVAEMADYAKKLTKTENGQVTRHGLAVTLDRWHVANWIGGQGEFSYVGNNNSGRAGDMTKVIFDENGTMKKFLTEYDKVVKSGGLQPNADKPREEFVAGQYAMVIQSSSRIAQFTEMTKGVFDIGAASLPKVDAADKGGVAVGGGALYLLNRNDQAQADAGWDVMKYLCSPEVQFKWHTSTGYIPTNANTYNMPEMKTWLESNPMYSIPINDLTNSNPNVQEPLDPNPLELSAIYKDTIMAFIEGKLTVDQAVAEMATKCNASLDLYYRSNS